MENMEETGICSEELYIASMMPKLNMLAGIMRELGYETYIMVGKDLIPCVEVLCQEVSISMSYYPTGESQDRQYILVMRSTAGEAEGFNCGAYNEVSLFGYAVVPVGTRDVELRAQIPEKGADQPEEFYGYITDLFIQSMESLKEALERNT